MSSHCKGRDSLSLEGFEIYEKKLEIWCCSRPYHNLMKENWFQDVNIQVVSVVVVEIRGVIIAKYS